jgi:hypothetical protein
MGSKPLILNHNFIFELWNDPMFWEQVSVLEEYRDEAEVEVAKAIQSQSSLSIKVSLLYNLWIKMLRAWHDTEPAKLKQLTDYIHSKRLQRREAIVIPADSQHREPLIISEGVG